jgi:hypothetical protein
MARFMEADGSVPPPHPQSARRESTVPETSCVDLRSISTVKPPASHVCDECAKIGSRWVHLRTCQSCGATLCCDSSPNRHASAHARSSGHPVIASAEPGERWLYCYPHDAFTEY